MDKDKKHKIETTIQLLDGMTNREIAEILVKYGVYIIPRDKKKVIEDDFKSRM